MRPINSRDILLGAFLVCLTIAREATTISFGPMVSSEVDGWRYPPCTYRLPPPPSLFPIDCIFTTSYPNPLTIPSPQTTQLSAPWALGQPSPRLPRR
ncbi:hypothetical protein HDK77DRAFT_442248 [Phyllosticta capitalensis]|uniref:uncharacterized protein n=1 Tax=Phyllosticta capitalensis TaxID=121624 RepID=UPI00313290BE